MSEFVEIENVKEGDEILSVEFRHACGNVLDPGSPKGTVDGKLVADISEKACTACGDYSGFDFFRQDRRKVPGEPDRAERQLNQEKLRQWLPEYVRRPTAEWQRAIQELLKTGRLRLGFKVRRMDEKS